MIQVPQFTNEFELSVKASEKPMELVELFSRLISQVGIEDIPDRLYKIIQEVIEYVSCIINIEEKIGSILDPIPESLAGQREIIESCY